MELDSIISSMKWETAVLGDPLAPMRNRHSVLTEPVSYLLETGGKKLRALLVYASAQMGSYRDNDLARAVAAVETLHLASLVHDDLLDNSHLRRGFTTVNHRWGSGTALLVGDFLYARCFALLQPLGEQVMTVLLETIVDMVEAELKQLTYQKNLHTEYQDYLAIIKGKTASFISACCQIGGLIGGLPPPSISWLNRFGYNLGLAYQIRDDTMDYALTDSSRGKPTGSDLRQGTVTLPLILYLQKCSPDARAEIDSLFRSNSPPPGQINQLCSRIRDSGVLTDCSQLVNDYLDQAAECLESLPIIPVLYQLVDYLRLDSSSLTPNN
jgi:geranylgeranyl pyrophosphate synthase